MKMVLDTAYIVWYNIAMCTNTGITIDYTVMCMCGFFNLISRTNGLNLNRERQKEKEEMTTAVQSVLDVLIHRIIIIKMMIATIHHTTQYRLQ